MKNIFKTLLILVMLSGCASNRYVLNDNNKVDKTFLVKEIKKAKKEGKISSNKPIIVVDGVPKRYSHELKEKKLNLSKGNIKEINILKQDIGVRLYGDFAKGGVFVITTQQEIDMKDKQKSDEGKSLNSLFKNNKILVFIDGKEATSGQLKNIKPNDIDTVSVLKSEAAKKLFSNKSLDGVIYITLKFNPED